jgi:hypothetical protein
MFVLAGLAHPRLTFSSREESQKDEDARHKAGHDGNYCAITLHRRAWVRRRVEAEGVTRHFRTRLAVHPDTN